MDNRNILLAYCLKHNNNWDRILQAIEHHEGISDEDWEEYDAFQVNFITMLDTEYPERLRHRYKPPFVLYYDGDIDVLKRIKDDNDLIFLHGDNIFNIPRENLITITDDNCVDIAGRLKVWFNNESTNVDRFGLAASLASSIVCTKIYDSSPAVAMRSWFNCISVPCATNMNADIYYRATEGPSFNNRMIKDGAFLIDDIHDIRKLYNY